MMMIPVIQLSAYLPRVALLTQLLMLVGNQLYIEYLPECLATVSRLRIPSGTGITCD